MCRTNRFVSFLCSNTLRYFFIKDHIFGLGSAKQKQGLVDKYISSPSMSSVHCWGSTPCSDGHYRLKKNPASGYPSRDDPQGRVQDCWATVGNKRKRAGEDSWASEAWAVGYKWEGVSGTLGQLGLELSDCQSLVDWRKRSRRRRRRRTHQLRNTCGIKYKPRGG